MRGNDQGPTSHARSRRCGPGLPVLGPVVRFSRGRSLIGRAKRVLDPAPGGLVPSVDASPIEVQQCRETPVAAAVAGPVGAVVLGYVGSVVGKAAGDLVANW